jgi:N utilization substance protein B
VSTSSAPSGPSGPSSPDTAGKARRSARRPGARPSANASRRRSREFALQGLYEWLISGSDVAAIDTHMREQEGFQQCDSAHFDALLQGCVQESEALDAALTRHTDRKASELSPVEHAILMIGAFEMLRCIDVPYRVVINEAVELAKSFGGTDGHKYVNGVLDRAASDWRAAEVAAQRPR